MAYLATLHGCDVPNRKKLYDALSNPKVGDMVLEISTIYSEKHVGTRLGRLNKIAKEDFPYSEKDRQYFLEHDGRVPQETAYYIELPDGTEFRWTNANFIKVLEDIPRP